ncbi:MAG: hypothetical protein LMBGKNDO_00531 [Bacteroidales bacterium]|nr:hypothetical protein [Bacteroidales bacterium]
MSVMAKRIQKIVLLMMLAAVTTGVSVFGQGKQKTAAERTSIGNIIHFFSQPVNYSREPVHPSEIVIFADSLPGVRSEDPAERILDYVWESQREPGRTRFEKLEDGTFLARLIWAPGTDGEEERKDFRNPNKKLRDRPIKDLVYCDGIVYCDGKWIAPYLYHPNFGITANKGVIFFNKDGDLIIRGTKWGFSSTECFKAVDIVP